MTGTTLRIEQTNLSSSNSTVTSGGDVELGTTWGPGLYKQLWNKASNAAMRLGSSTAMTDSADTACFAYIGVGKNVFGDTQDISNYSYCWMSPGQTGNIALTSFRNGLVTPLFQASAAGITNKSSNRWPGFELTASTGELILKHPAALPVLDQQFTSRNAASAAPNSWQSVTSGIGGLLTSVDIQNSSGVPATGCTIRIFNGAGVGGALLTSEAAPTLPDNTWVNIPLSSPVYIGIGSQFTIQVYGGSNFAWAINTGGGYSGGSFMGGGTDALFRTYVNSEIMFYSSYNGTSHNKFISTVATGTAPFSCTSTTECTNLNAAKVNGYDFDQSLKKADAVQFSDITIGTNTGSSAGLQMRSAATNEVGVSFYSGSSGKWYLYRPASSNDLALDDAATGRDLLTFVTGGAIKWRGTGSTINGPHWYTYTSDDATYPIFHMLNYGHDNITLAFDTYYDGANWKSCDAGSNFTIKKYNDRLSFEYGSGVAAGSNVTLGTAFYVNTSGQIVSSIATGTAPISVSSTTVCPSLNASYISGYSLNQDVATSGTPTWNRIQIGNFTDYWNITRQTDNNLNFWFQGYYKADISETDGTYTKASDRRLKGGITLLTDVLAKVLRSKPSKFYLLDDPNMALKIGNIAQDLLEDFPELISQGKIRDDEEELYYRVSESGSAFGAICFAAIQEQQAIINALEDRIEALEVIHQ